MFKRLTALLLIICTVCTLFGACGEEEDINIIYPISADPECLDPQIVDNQAAEIIVANCMEGLVRIGKNGEILPGVAQSWSVSGDGLTYTFNLRNDAVWQMLRTHSNVLGEDYEKTFSTAVTAYDCAFGIERALRPETKAEDAYLLYPIKNAVKFNNGEVGRNSLGIEVIDDTTLIIRLDRAYPDLLRVLAEPMCMPCDEEFFKATGAKYGLELKYTLCNGPFYVGRWADDSSLTLYRNENYSGYSDFDTDAVYLYVNSKEEQYISKFNQGDYNAASVSSTNISLVNKDATVLTTSNSVYGFIFNCEDSVLSQPEIRKALVNAIDLSAMDKDVSGYTKAGGLIPQSCRWGGYSYRETVGDLNIPSFNSDVAVNYFASALDSLETSNINISIVCPEEFRTAIIRMIQKWEKIFGLSLTVSVNALNDEELKTAVEKGEYQIAFTKLSADDGNALSFLNNFISENDKNYANYQDAEFDELINKCKTSNKGNNIALAYKNAENMLVTQGVFYPVYNAESYICVKDNALNTFGLAGFAAIDFAAWSDADEN